MSKEAINQRFISVFKTIKQSTEGFKHASFASSIGISPQVLTEILGGRQSISLEALQNFFVEYGVSYSYIFTGDEPVFNARTPSAKNQNAAESSAAHHIPLPSEGQKLSQKLSATLSATHNNPHLAAEPASIYARAPQVISVDSSGNENIIFVPHKAAAGYLTGYADREFMETLPTYRLPGMNNGTFRMFEVSGLSMSPTIQSGDKVVGEWCEHFSDIRDNRIYIVVTHNGIAVKRLLNRISQRGKLVCKSDTINHRHDYPTYEIEPADVKELWYARLKFSPDFSEPAEVYHRLSDLESDMLEVKNILSSLPQLTQLAKQFNKPTE